MAKCYICQKQKAVEGELLCSECEQRRANPPHSHQWKETYRIKASSSSGQDIAYYECATCSERTMGTI